MHIFISGALAFLLAGGVARAADLESRIAPSEPAAFNWSGVYLGGGIGYGWLDDVDYSFTPPLHSEGEHWIVGLHVGYLHQFGPFVAGLEGEYLQLNINFEGFPIDVTDSRAMKLRGGFAIDRLLFTGHAGAAYVRTNIGLEDWGWVAGAGIDYAVTDHFVVGISYDHMDFKEFDNTMIDATLDLLKVRASFKF